MIKKRSQAIRRCPNESIFGDAFRILFCGDLILLEDQVKNAYTGSGYDFSSLFEYTKRYIQAADFAIGVFEGPCGGTRRLYSQSNYGDKVPLYLNYPDEFADDVKNAGFDLVTLATNHVLDMAEDGAKRTIDVLDQKQLPHVGAYRDPSDKNERRIKIIEKGGIKMAILAYASTVNHYARENFIDGEYQYLISVLVPGNSKYYEEIRERVRADFETAKSFAPDLIIALPHWGVQFTDEPSSFQKLWRQNFLEFGADIILGDHTHSVQPAVLENFNGRMTYTLYCPGNYANIYRGHDGDATAMAEVYIDRKTKKPIGGAIIPMWTQSPFGGNYRALPIFDIVNDPKLGKEISTRDMERVKEIQKHVTRVMLGKELDLNLLQERYYHDAEGFMRSSTSPLKITDAMKSGVFYRLLTGVKGVCFVGDSVTEGTMNGGVPWYEPIEYLIEGNVFNCGWGNCTTKRLLKKHLAEITSAEAELFVIAIGCNDVRYRNPEVCAMEAAEYVEQLKGLRAEIIEKRPSAKFLFIAPWVSTDGDRISKLGYVDKIKMNAEYSAALKKMCAEFGDAFIDPTAYIQQRLNLYPRSKYLRDWIHPNATEGVRFYSEAVMMS